MKFVELTKSKLLTNKKRVIIESTITHYHKIYCSLIIMLIKNSCVVILFQKMILLATEKKVCKKRKRRL